MGHVSGKIEYSQLQIKLGGNITGELIKNDKKMNKSPISENENKDFENGTPPKSLQSSNDGKI